MFIKAGSLVSDFLFGHFLVNIKLFCKCCNSASFTFFISECLKHCLFQHLDKNPKCTEMQQSLIMVNIAK